MDCAECRSLISPYLDGELDADEGVRLKDHLARCEGCKRELAALTATGELVRIHAPEAVPDEGYWETLSRRVVHRIEALPAPALRGGREPLVERLFRPWTVRLAGGAALATALLLVALRFGFGGRASAPDIVAAPKQHQETRTLAAPTEPVQDSARPSLLAAEPPRVQAVVAADTPQTSEPAPTQIGREDTARTADDILLAAAPPQAALGSGGGAAAAAFEAKPARGGMAEIARLHEERAQEQFQALLILPQTESDSLTKRLRAEEMRLRGELTAVGDSSAMPGREAELADVLYRLAVRTEDRRDINRALLLWRPAYDRLAAALGDSVARARMTQLERLVLGERGQVRE